MPPKLLSRYKRIVASSTLTAFLLVYSSAIGTINYFKLRNIDPPVAEQQSESLARKLLEELSTHPPASEEENRIFAAKLGVIDLRPIAPCYDLREAAKREFDRYYRNSTPENIEQLKSILGSIVRDC
ncbi:MAG: hypothetical protein QOF62_279 [Pyrinomonadaceae bacterium]|jgi:hypothetical protein|nr:hypothetical protein [Pyrinomonadaceae bacterium]